MSGTTSHESLDFLSWEGPAVGLLDMDAFFASVEVLDHPEWKGKPLIVGGPPNSRGVVSTASYEARSFGVHSGMPAYQAAKLCPDAIWTTGNYARYREESHKVINILLDETPYVEQVSIDEAFFDITPGRYSNESPIAVCKRIQKRVLELDISCSIGLATSKSLAKLASEEEKPKGLTVVLPGSEFAFVEHKSTRELSGIGPAQQKALEDLGIHTLGELVRADSKMLEENLGQTARKMQERAKGIEHSPVRAIDDYDDAKSISVERTFAKDLKTRDELERALEALSIKLAERLRKEEVKGSTITIKIRFDLNRAISAQTTLPAPTALEEVICEFGKELLFKSWHEGDSVRLLGIGMSNFSDQETQQLSLFSDEDGIGAELSRTRDRIREKFGKDALSYGKEIRVSEQIRDRE